MCFGKKPLKGYGIIVRVKENEEKFVKDYGCAISNSQMDFLGFLSETLLTISWLMWAFIVWVKK